MFRKITLIIAITTVCLSAAVVNPPKPYGALPSKDQLAWHEVEYYGLVCFGLNTYTGQEWGYGDKSPALFNPSNLDTDQWARVSKQAGMKGLILVAKHHDGFCLWPTKTTKYSVAASPWKDGKGDVLGDLAKSCKKYGLKLGVYISPWDRNHAEYGKPGYLKDFQEQWREVLTNYGDIFEVWFDGANGGSGFYGGAREQRQISKDYYQFGKLHTLIKSLQPQAVFFGAVGDFGDCRWVGNEQGYAGETNWCTINNPQEGNTHRLGVGDKSGKFWIPAEADTTILYPKKWYYNTSSKPRTLDNFVNLYYTTIGRNASFNLGLSIGPDGLIPDDCVKSMLAQKKQIDLDFATNLASKAKVTVSDSRGNNSSYGASKVNDKSTDTYWATNNGVSKASITLDFGKDTTFNRLLLQEYIALGQRIHKFTLEVEEGGTWRQITEETTIGYKRILRFKTTKASKVRITFETDADALMISNVGVYKAPAILSEPKISRDKHGNVSITNSLQDSIYYSINKGKYQKYTKPFTLTKGGDVDSYAVDAATDHKTDIATKKFGLSKTNWKIMDCSFPNKGDASVKRLIDGNNNTMWHTHGEKGKQPPPHWVTIDLAETMEITGFSCMPRHDNCAIGLVDQYEFYVSTDGKSWGKPVAHGEFSNIKNNPINQVVSLKKPIKARYIKFVAKGVVEGGCVAICELGVIIR